MNGVKWIKLDTGIFQSPKVRKLRRMPSGDTIALIYIDLLTLAGRQGGTGELMLTEGMPFDLEDLAFECDTDVNTMRMAMTMLQQLGMVGLREDGCYVIDGWDDHQAVDGATLKNRERQRRYRERQKAKRLLAQAEAAEAIEAEAFAAVEDCPSQTTELANDATQSVTRDVTDYALEIRDKSKEEEQKEKAQKEKLEGDVTHVIDYLNARSGKRFNPRGEQARKVIRARLSGGYTVDDLKAVIDAKCAEWLNDQHFCKYLRPSTLFAPGHFDEYLANARSSPPQARAPGGQPIDFSIYD
ncbi:MAG: phage replisome organizer N-terminal domain-containing protein [Atopobiaceae bacterium]|nr:phage replisome organizer N-terminal domain-containing protein [Atopobiaceae bacterium]